MLFEIPVVPSYAYVCLQSSPPLAALLGGIVRFPPDQRSLSYKDLLCTGEDRANICELFSAIGEKGEFGLLLDRTHLKQLGAQFSHVHPLKVLETIFINPEIKRSMPSIFTDYFKRSGIMNGLGPSLTREAEKGTLDKYLPDFGKELGVSVDALRMLCAVRDWDGLMYYLMQQEIRQNTN